MLIASLLTVGTIGVFRRAIPLPSALLAFSRGLIGSRPLFLYARLSGKGGSGAHPRWKTRRAGPLCRHCPHGSGLYPVFRQHERPEGPDDLDPVTAMLVSALVLREGLTWEGLLGAVLILGYAIVSERTPERPGRQGL